jgi:hypothetical protein
MMLFFRSFRVARALGLLAVLLTIGSGPHLHPAKLDLAQVVAGDCVNVPSEQDAPALIHCASCHAARAVVPAPAVLRAPMVVANRQIPVESTPLVDPQPSGVPSPPPKRGASA